MTPGPNQYVALAVRLFSIGIFVVLLRQLTALAVFPDTAGERYTLLQLSLCAVLFLIAVLLYAFPRLVARRIFDFEQEKPQSSVPVPAQQLYVLGFILMGVFLLLRALADISYWAFTLIWLDRYEAAAWGPQDMASMAATAVEIVLALALIFGARGIANLVIGLRWAGHRETSVDS